MDLGTNSDRDGTKIAITVLQASQQLVPTTILYHNSIKRTNKKMSTLNSSKIAITVRFQGNIMSALRLWGNVSGQNVTTIIRGFVIDGITAKVDAIKELVEQQARLEGVSAEAIYASYSSSPSEEEGNSQNEPFLII